MMGEQKKINSELLTERSSHLTRISELNDVVTSLNSQLEQVKKQVDMMTNGSTVLEDDVTEGQDRRKANGVCFDYKQRNRKSGYALEDHGMIRKEEQVKGVKVIDSSGTDVVGKTMLKHSQGHQNDKKTTRHWICHHCKRKGHIRSYCYKLYGYPQPRVQPKVSGMIPQSRKEWRLKTPNVSSSVTSSMSISVPHVLTKSGNLGQSSLNVVDADNTIEKCVSVSACKTAIAPDVVSDVTTSLVRPDHIKSKSESSFDNGKSQYKMVSVCAENDGLEIDDQSVWSLLLF
jgi:uncharacterized coiled-coil protein SlyX